VNGDDGVGEVVLATEHFLGLGGLDLLAQGVEGSGQVGQYLLAAASPLEQHADVVGFSGQAGGELTVFGEAALTL
jgi:hypothetical protein